MMNYYDEIKELLLDDDVYAKVKDYSKDSHRLMTNFKVGKLLFEAGNTYGEDIIGNYSEKLVTEVGKKI